MLTSRQISEWEAYDRIDPVGEWREDFRMAFLSSLITNLAISIHGKKGTKQTTLMDFMPKWDVDEPKKGLPMSQSIEDMKKVMYDIANASKKKKRVADKPPTALTNKKKDGI